MNQGTLKQIFSIIAAENFIKTSNLPSIEGMLLPMDNSARPIGLLELKPLGPLAHTTFS
jgi:hypothetical protein